MIAITCHPQVALRLRQISCPHGVPAWALCSVCEEKELSAIRTACSRPWSPAEGQCPYCGGGPCEHWMGMGWVKKPEPKEGQHHE